VSPFVTASDLAFLSGSPFEFRASPEIQGEQRSLSRETRAGIAPGCRVLSYGWGALSHAAPLARVSRGPISDFGPNEALAVDRAPDRDPRDKKSFWESGSIRPATRWLARTGRREVRWLPVRVPHAAVGKRSRKGRDQHSEHLQRAARLPWWISPRRLWLLSVDRRFSRAPKLHKLHPIPY
jgi:hypothetical protein